MNFVKKIRVLIYTYNRTDDARINMGIIRNEWSRLKLFKKVKIIYAYNGKKEWYPEKYLEDELVRIKNSWHFQGASDLIDAGFKTIKEKYKDLGYIIVLAADTWMIKPEYIEKIIREMSAKKLLWTTCPWGRKGQNEMRDVGAATDFFIINCKWATKNRMFPLNFKIFSRKYMDLLFYVKGQFVMLEKLIFLRFNEAFARAERKIFYPRFESQKKY